MCIQACLPEKAGCYCEYPYVRSKNGDCVKKDQCKEQSNFVQLTAILKFIDMFVSPAIPTCTRPHEKYQSCSNGCQTTCKNYNNPPICTMQCFTELAGCYCEYPYIRNDNGDCVLKNECKGKTSSLFTSILNFVKALLKFKKRSEHSVV